MQRLTTGRVGRLRALTVVAALAASVFATALPASAASEPESSQPVLTPHSWVWHSGGNFTTQSWVWHR